MRQYWQPAALVDEFDGPRPVRRVRLLGEDLVLFRDPAGRYGLLDRHCAHRGADLSYGRAEDGCAARFTAGSTPPPAPAWSSRPNRRAPALPQDPPARVSLRSPAAPARLLGAPLRKAQGSGASVLAFASTGSDLVNAIKQAKEFGVTPKMTPAALFAELTDVEAMGLPVAQGLKLTEAFYWDLNDATRAWSKRYGAVMNGRMPTEDQAGVYSATLAYLQSVHDAKRIEGEKVVGAMRRTPITDALFGPVTIRADGRAIHDMHRFCVKSPAESRGKYDDYVHTSTIPADVAFRPFGAGGCRLVQ